MNIDGYLESKKEIWSASTQRSERFRLQGIKNHVDGNPDRLWKAISDYGSYSRLTIWTRVVDYYTWENKGPNPYKEFKEKNPQLFRNVYFRAKPRINYQDARGRISSISNDIVRKLAFRILESGERFFEAIQKQGPDGDIVGKGKKRRIVFRTATGTEPIEINYHAFRAHLGRVGLKPHDLRKLFLSRLVELGANEFELCEIAGWSSIATASSYVNVNRSRIKSLVEKL